MLRRAVSFKKMTEYVCAKVFAGLSYVCYYTYVEVWVMVMGGWVLGVGGGGGCAVDVVQKVGEPEEVVAVADYPVEVDTFVVGEVVG